VADHHQTGSYVLNFGSSVEGHPILAMLQDQAGTGLSVRATVCGGAAVGPDALDCASTFNDADHVGVRVFDNTGTNTNQPFYVVVFS
jgi:hypothetical protein